MEIESFPGDPEPVRFESTTKPLIRSPKRPFFAVMNLAGSNGLAATPRQCGGGTLTTSPL